MAKKQAGAPPAADQAAAQSTQNQPEASENKPEDGGNVETKAQNLPEAADTVHVQFLRSHPALAYSPGERAYLPRELYDRYLEDGPFYKVVAAAPTE